MVDRRWIARIAAPAAFLLGVTVFVLLVRAGLDDDGSAARTTSPTATLTATTAPRATVPTATAPPTTTAPQPVFATVKAGDTLDVIASAHDTTVERVLQLNPGLDPTNLQIGQRVRVR